MTKREILTKAIEKAVAGGYDDKTENLESVYKLIIFNHDFAKALWGDEPHEQHFGMSCSVTQPTFCFHLQQMVIADDPIKYLGDNI